MSNVPLQSATVRIRRKALQRVLVAIAAGLLALVIGSLALLKVSPIIPPLLAALVGFGVFVLILKGRVGENLFGEVGFLYLGLTTAYTAIPAATFLLVGLDVVPGGISEHLAALLPSTTELGFHLWRHVLFMFGVAAGYIVVRGRKLAAAIVEVDSTGKPAIIIWFLIITILLCHCVIYLLSAPVETYIDHYTRFDHLPRFARLFVYICLSFKTSYYFILLTFLFHDYRKYRKLIPFVVAAIGVYETIYSFGSRIETLSILFAVVCLYHYCARRITLKKGAMALVAIATLFSFVELVRIANFDIAAAKESITTDGAAPATEFGAVYFTGFHLYAERAAGSLPERELPLLFNDIILLIPFVDHTRWNPQYWYARNFFPDAVVPPQTMGPIAESAMWGGEIDLLLRGILNGVVFAALTRWFLRRSGRWPVVVVYVYVYSTCIMALKYSVFYHLAPLLRIIGPGLLSIWFLLFVLSSLRRHAGALSPAVAIR